MDENKSEDPTAGQPSLNLEPDAAHAPETGATSNSLEPVGLLTPSEMDENKSKVPTAGEPFLSLESDASDSLKPADLITPEMVEIKSEDPTAEEPSLNLEPDAALAPETGSTNDSLKPVGLFTPSEMDEIKSEDPTAEEPSLNLEPDAACGPETRARSASVKRSGLATPSNMGDNKLYDPLARQPIVLLRRVDEVMTINLAPESTAVDETLVTSDALEPVALTSPSKMDENKSDDSPAVKTTVLLPSLKDTVHVPFSIAQAGASLLITVSNVATSESKRRVSYRKRKRKQAQARPQEGGSQLNPTPHAAQMGQTGGKRPLVGSAANYDAKPFGSSLLESTVRHLAAVLGSGTHHSVGGGDTGFNVLNSTAKWLPFPKKRLKRLKNKLKWKTDSSRNLPVLPCADKSSERANDDRSVAAHQPVRRSASVPPRVNFFESPSRHAELPAPRLTAEELRNSLVLSAVPVSAVISRRETSVRRSDYSVGASGRPNCNDSLRSKRKRLQLATRLRGRGWMKQQSNTETQANDASTSLLSLLSPIIVAPEQANVRPNLLISMPNWAPYPEVRPKKMGRFRNRRSLTEAEVKGSRPCWSVLQHAKVTPERAEFRLNLLISMPDWVTFPHLWPTMQKLFRNRHSKRESPASLSVLPGIDATSKSNVVWPISLQNAGGKQGASRRSASVPPGVNSTESRLAGKPCSGENSVGNSLATNVSTFNKRAHGSFLSAGDNGSGVHVANNAPSWQPWPKKRRKRNLKKLRPTTESLGGVFSTGPAGPRLPVNVASHSGSVRPTPPPRASVSPRASQISNSNSRNANRTASGVNALDSTPKWLPFVNKRRRKNPLNNAKQANDQSSNSVSLRPLLNEPPGNSRVIPNLHHNRAPNWVPFPDIWPKKQKRNPKRPSKNEPRLQVSPVCPPAGPPRIIRPDFQKVVPASSLPNALPIRKRVKKPKPTFKLNQTGNSLGSSSAVSKNQVNFQSSSSFGGPGVGEVRTPTLKQLRNRRRRLLKRQQLSEAKSAGKISSPHPALLPTPMKSAPRPTNAGPKVLEGRPNWVPFPELWPKPRQRSKNRQSKGNESSSSSTGLLPHPNVTPGSFKPKQKQMNRFRNDFSSNDSQPPRPVALLPHPNVIPNSLNAMPKQTRSFQNRPSNNTSQVNKTTFASAALLPRPNVAPGNLKTGTKKKNRLRKRLSNNKSQTNNPSLSSVLPFLPRHGSAPVDVKLTPKRQNFRNRQSRGEYSSVGFSSAPAPVSLAPEWDLVRRGFSQRNVGASKAPTSSFRDSDSFEQPTHRYEERTTYFKGNKVVDSHVFSSTLQLSSFSTNLADYQKRFVSDGGAMSTLSQRNQAAGNREISYSSDSNFDAPSRTYKPNQYTTSKFISPNLPMSSNLSRNESSNQLGGGGFRSTLSPPRAAPISQAASNRSNSFSSDAVYYESPSRSYQQPSKTSQYGNSQYASSTLPLSSTSSRNDLNYQTSNQLGLGGGSSSEFRSTFSQPSAAPLSQATGSRSIPFSSYSNYYEPSRGYQEQTNQYGDFQYASPALPPSPEPNYQSSSQLGGGARSSLSQPYSAPASQYYSTPISQSAGNRFTSYPPQYEANRQEKSQYVAPPLPPSSASASSGVLPPLPKSTPSWSTSHLGAAPESAPYSRPYGANASQSYVTPETPLSQYYRPDVGQRLGSTTFSSTSSLPSTNVQGSNNWGGYSATGGNYLDNTSFDHSASLPTNKATRRSPRYGR